MNENTTLSLINRTREVFSDDWHRVLNQIRQRVNDSRVLVVGGAGSIGSAVVEVLHQMCPRALHVVDINENGLADLVRQIRSTDSARDIDFRTICNNMLHENAETMADQYGPYDAILNFAAVKHVRSEKDPYTLSRMFRVNLGLMRRLVEIAVKQNTTTLFSVSTDKAANPANLMGASKRLMEMIGFLFANETFSTARFANVAFSNGSLLKAFWDRIDRGQPISAPSNIKRFFITHEEAARLCLLGAFAGPKHRISIPKAFGEVELTSFVDVARNVLASRGFEPLVCRTEEDARRARPSGGKWPCFFFESDTSGEKPFEEFIGVGEGLVESPFDEVGMIGTLVEPDEMTLQALLDLDPASIDKEELIERVGTIVPGFAHVETGKNLDQRM